jgi:hypothetical protein
MEQFLTSVGNHPGASLMLGLFIIIVMFIVHDIFVVLTRHRK